MVTYLGLNMMRLCHDFCFVICALLSIKCVLWLSYRLHWVLLRIKAVTISIWFGNHDFQVYTLHSSDHNSTFKLLMLCVWKYSCWRELRGDSLLLYLIYTSSYKHVSVLFRKKWINNLMNKWINKQKNR